MPHTVARLLSAPFGPLLPIPQTSEQATPLETLSILKTNRALDSFSHVAKMGLIGTAGVYLDYKKAIVGF